MVNTNGFGRKAHRFIRAVAVDLGLQDEEIDVYTSDTAAMIGSSGYVRGREMFGVFTGFDVVIGYSKRDMFENIAHELRHVWQYKTGMIDSFNSSNPNLSLVEYLSLPEEIDARKYAESFVEKYRSEVK